MHLHNLNNKKKNTKGRVKQELVQVHITALYEQHTRKVAAVAAAHKQ